MASGVTIADECKQQFEGVKRDKKARYIVYMIRDEKQIVVEKVGDRNAKYQDFLQDLLAAGPDDCRYGVFDYEYEHQCQGAATESHKQKLILLSCVLDNEGSLYEEFVNVHVEFAEGDRSGRTMFGHHSCERCPDTAKVKKKMLYSSSFDALKKSLVGVAKYIQATDESEASKEAVEEKLRANDRS